MGPVRAPRLVSRLGAAMLAAGVAVAAILVVPATPAQAVPGLTTRVASSDHDSSATKEARAVCPRETVILGGGGTIIGRSAKNVRLVALVPYRTGYVGESGYRVRGEEYGAGYAGDWSVVSYAICGREPNGWVRVSRQSPLTTSDSMQGAAATCLGDKRVIGAGASITNGGGRVGLSHMLPTPASLTSVVAVAHEDPAGHSDWWQVTATAICVDPVPGQEWVPGSPGVWPVCPAGKTIHGVGGYLTDGWGEVQLKGIYPLANGAFAKTSAGDNHAFTVAICAN